LLRHSFPKPMQKRFAKAIDAHRLRPQIIATRMANAVVNRMGVVAPFELAEEEGASIAHVAAAYFAADAIFDLQDLWDRIEAQAVSEDARLALFEAAASTARLHLADLLRAMGTDELPGETAARLKPGITRLDKAAKKLLREEARSQASVLRARIEALGADAALVDRIVRLDELDGAVGIADLCKANDMDEIDATTAYVRLGEALGLDWAKAAALRCVAADQWEHLLIAGLNRDFEQLRMDFLCRLSGENPVEAVEAWLVAQRPRIAQFRALIDRARTAALSTPAMLAQLASQARVLLVR